MDLSVYFAKLAKYSLINANLPTRRKCWCCMAISRSNTFSTGAETSSLSECLVEHSTWVRLIVCSLPQNSRGARAYTNVILGRNSRNDSRKHKMYVKLKHPEVFRNFMFIIAEIKKLRDNVRVVVFGCWNCLN